MQRNYHRVLRFKFQVSVLRQHGLLSGNRRHLQNDTRFFLEGMLESGRNAIHSSP
jgi:hypothetical protein